jgi:hypothetical protein
MVIFWAAYDFETKNLAAVRWFVKKKSDIVSVRL